MDGYTKWEGKLSRFSLWHFVLCGGFWTQELNVTYRYKVGVTAGYRRLVVNDVRDRAIRHIVLSGGIECCLILCQSVWIRQINLVLLFWTQGFYLILP